MNSQSRLLAGLSRALQSVADDEPPGGALTDLLHVVVEVACSEYGFIAEAVADGAVSRQFELLAATGPATNGKGERLFKRSAASGEPSPWIGLCQRVAEAREAVFSNNIAPGGGDIEGREEERREEPTIHGFLGLPLVAGGSLKGVLGLLNRPEGFDQPLVDLLQPVPSVCVTVLSLHNRRAQPMAQGAERIFAISPGLLCVVDFDGRLKQVNPAWQTSLGYLEHELLGYPFIDFVHPQDRESTAAAMSQLRAGSEAVSVDTHWLRKDGDICSLRWTIAPDNEREVFYAAASGGGACEAASAQLETASRRVRAIHNSVGEGIVTVNALGVVESFNRAASILFGYAREETVGNNIKVLFPESCHGEYDDYVQRCEHASLHRGIDLGIEVEGRHKDGSVFAIDVQVTPLLMGGQRKLTAIIRDITGRKEVDRMRNEALAAAAHELRTPLTAIHGALRLMEEGMAGELPKTATDLVAVAANNSSRMVRLVSHILDLEKLKAGKQELERRDLRAASLVDETLRALRGTAARADVQLNSLVEEGVTLCGDRDRLVQVLTNLVSNAINFSPQGADVEIAVATVAGPSVRFVVKDRGPGIPPEQIGGLFQKFRQLDDTPGRRCGTGLGLVISKEIVERHDGRIGVNSRPGEGSSFWFELPA